jgi:hypothetical protein
LGASGREIDVENRDYDGQFTFVRVIRHRTWRVLVKMGLPSWRTNADVGR